MKIVAGGPVQENAHVLAASMEMVRGQELPEGVTLDLTYVDDLDWERAWEGDVTVLRSPGKQVWKGPGQDQLNLDARIQSTHLWTIDRIERVAQGRQMVLNHAADVGADMVWFVDGDLLPARDTLGHMLDLHGLYGGIMCGVFWTVWDRDVGDLPWPQVWDEHPSRFSSDTWASLANGGVRKVHGGGACMLMPTPRLHLPSILRYHPRMGGLPQDSMWQGEDRSFCLRAEAVGVPIYATGAVRIMHLYHDYQRTEDYVGWALGAIRGMTAGGHREHGLSMDRERPHRTFAQRAFPI